MFDFRYIAKIKNKSERKANFIFLEIVDTRDIKNTRNNITLLLDIINLKIILI